MKLGVFHIETYESKFPGYIKTMTTLQLVLGIFFLRFSTFMLKKNPKIKDAKVV